MRILGTLRCLCTAFGVTLLVPASASAQTDAEGPVPTSADYEEIQLLIDSLQTRVVNLTENAKKSDAAIEFLNNQIDEAIGLLLIQDEENTSLRGKTSELNAVMEDLAQDRVELKSQVANLEGEKERAVDTLEDRLLELADLLSLERKTTATLRDELGEKGNELQATLTDRDEARRDLDQSQTSLEVSMEELAAARKLIAAYEETIDDQRTRLSDMEAALERDKGTTDDLLVRLATAELASAKQAKLTEAARTESAEQAAKVERLSRQISELNEQLAALTSALDVAEIENKDQKAKITDLDRRLNIALASKIQELARFRSEFFGRLREVLGERPDLRVVGDRFVLQSELLFESASDQLGEAGKRQLARLARTLREISEDIPHDIDWVLRVDGHTDQQPIETPRFPSNWELSTARAISVVRFLIAQGIPAKRLVAAGFAAFQPLDHGEDEIAYRRNRRIELKLTQK